MLHLNGGRKEAQRARADFHKDNAKTDAQFQLWGSLSNNDGDGYENVTKKVTSNFIVLIPSRFIRQMLEFL